jgi:hypothetical protein
MNLRSHLQASHRSSSEDQRADRHAYPLQSQSGHLNRPVRGLLRRSRLAARWPVDDTDCLQGMSTHRNLTVTARLDPQLLGIARCLTDFHCCCHLMTMMRKANPVPTDWLRERERHMPTNICNQLHCDFSDVAYPHAELIMTRYFSRCLTQRPFCK